jgi:hypothetical protein
MQSQSHDIPTIPTNSSTSVPTTSSEHGILANELQSADLHDSVNVSERSGRADEGGDASPVDTEGAQDQLRRLNLGESNEERPKPSFQRISEYENALSPSPPRKASEGPGFKVVKKKGGRPDGPQLDQFPNGTSITYDNIAGTTK